MYLVFTLHYMKEKYRILVALWLVQLEVFLDVEITGETHQRRCK